MKKIILVTFALIIAGSCSYAQNDSVRTSATPTWQRIAFQTTTILSGYVINDGALGADSIYVSESITTDTTITNRHLVKAKESFSFSAKSIKNLWYRSAGGTTVPVRIALSSGSDVQIQSAPVGVSRSIVKDTVRFTRPANATQYSDSDRVWSTTATGGSMAAFTVTGTPGGSGYIVGAGIRLDTATVANGVFDIYAYEDSTGMGATLPADNALFKTTFDYGKSALDPFTIVLGNQNGSNATGSTGSRGSVSGLAIPFKCVAGSTKLYVVIVARAAYKPAQSGVIGLTLYTQPTN